MNSFREKKKKNKKQTLFTFSSPAVGHQHVLPVLHEVGPNSYSIESGLVSIVVTNKR